MSKCEHGLTSKECYVCASPKHGEMPQGKAEAFGYAHCLEARGFKAEASELRRLVAENERLHQINQSHEMKLSVRGYEIQIADLKAANVKLAGAIDMIRETLQGGNVDDLLYIINTALEEHRRNHG
jgi:hypothetical protein